MAKEIIREEQDDEEDKPKKKKQVLVVSQLPTQTIRSANYEGEDYELLTYDEAITEILRNVRDIKRAIA
jgi:hypothetical protein